MHFSAEHFTPIESFSLPPFCRPMRAQSCPPIGGRESGGPAYPIEGACPPSLPLSPFILFLGTELFMLSQDINDIRIDLDFDINIDLDSDIKIDLDSDISIDLDSDINIDLDSHRILTMTRYQY